MVRRERAPALRYRADFFACDAVLQCRIAPAFHRTHPASFFFSHAPAREILQNLFAFVIFLSHSFGILISVKGNPPRHQRMPPTTARLRWNRTGTCITAFPLRLCMFAQTKRSHLRGCFSYFPPKKKAVYAAFFIFLMNLKNRPPKRSVFMHFFA